MVNGMFCESTNELFAPRMPFGFGADAKDPEPLVLTDDEKSALREAKIKIRDLGA